MVLNSDQNRFLDKEYFYHLIARQDFSDCITGTGQPQIVRSPLASFLVCLPTTKEEQQSIAASLSEISDYNDSLENILVKKRRIKQGAMQDLLTGRTRLPGFEGQWEDQSVEQLGYFLKGKGVSRSQSQSGLIPCVRYGEIYTHHHEIVRIFQSFISEEVAADARPIARSQFRLKVGGAQTDWMIFGAFSSSLRLSSRRSVNASPLLVRKPAMGPPLMCCQSRSMGLKSGLYAER